MQIAEQKLVIWDTLLHTFSCFLLVIIGVFIIFRLKTTLKLTPLFIVIISLCFSMTCAVLWEIFEFNFDLFTKSDMQQDIIITSFTTKNKSLQKNTKKISLKKIDHTNIYDKDNNLLLKINNGYLDIGLIDTMKDLIVNLIGAVISSILCYIYCKRKRI